MKTCACCNKEKSLEEFSRRNRTLDGLDCYCKECIRLKNKLRIINPRIEITEYLPDFKVCNKCRQRKSSSEFNFNAASSSGYTACCKDCLRKYGRKRGRQDKLHNNFNMSELDYEMMLKSQNGVCAICGQPETLKSQNGEIMSLAVDHQEKPFKVRGILCHKCNTALGGFNDDPILLQKAISYLRESS